MLRRAKIGFKDLPPEDSHFVFQLQPKEFVFFANLFSKLLLNKN